MSTIAWEIGKFLLQWVAGLFTGTAWMNLIGNWKSALKLLVAAAAVIGLVLWFNPFKPDDSAEKAARAETAKSKQEATACQAVVATANVTTLKLTRERDEAGHKAAAAERERLAETIKRLTDYNAELQESLRKRARRSAYSAETLKEMAP